MRVFIGIDLSNETKEALYDLQRVWLMSTEKKRPTLFSNFHITLKYIGELNDEEVDLLYLALKKHLKDFEKFKVNIADIGTFKKGSGDILWVGFTEGKDILSNLHKNVLKAINASNIEVRKEKYVPHITLARNVTFNNRSYHLPLVNKEEEINFVTVFKSHHVNGILTYTPLYEIKLN